MKSLSDVGMPVATDAQWRGTFRACFVSVCPPSALDARIGVILIRFAALLAFYHSWCQSAWQEGSVEVTLWFSELEISTFRLAQLAGDDFLDDQEFTDTEMVEEAQYALIEQEYDRVSTAIQRSFASESALFLDLWQSREQGTADLGDEEADTNWTVLNDDVCPDKGSSSVWISNGCPMADAR